MAGIGFALRTLMRKDTLWAIFESMLHGIIAVAGPWFFTIIGMALPALLFTSAESKSVTDQFVTILLYVFSVSLTLTSPVAIGLTRHVSDCLYQKRESEISASLIGAVFLCFLCASPVAIFGMVYLDLPFEIRVLTLFSYGLVTMNWIVAPMLSTIRQFRALTLAYALGTLIFWLTIRGQHRISTAELLVGFNLGVCVTNALICGLVLHSFPGQTWPSKRLLQSMMRYWDLLLGGLLYGAGIWVDKWLMWTAPEHSELAGGLVTYPTYDTVAFLAYVTTVPAMALFIIEAETSFHQSCRQLYDLIQEHAALQTLNRARLNTIDVFRATCRDVAFLQICITALVLLLPTLLLDALGVAHSGVFMFRFCALGAAFQLGVMILSIGLHYFDSRRTILQINALFLAANALFTWLALRVGLRWYGFGYFIAGLTTFVVAYWLMTVTFRDMLYLAFVRQNAAVTQASAHAVTETQWFAAVTAPRDGTK